MIVQFSIHPLDSEHFSKDIHKVKTYLDGVGVDYRIGPIGTSIQGEWDAVLPIIQKCHQIIAKDHARVLTNITVDDHKGNEHTLDDAVKAAAGG